MEAAEAELAAIATGRPAGTVRIASFQSALLRIVAPAIARARAQPSRRARRGRRGGGRGAPCRPCASSSSTPVVGDEYEGQPRAIHADLVREPLLGEQVRPRAPRLRIPSPGPARVPLAQLTGRRLGGVPARDRAPRDAHPARAGGSAASSPTCGHASDDFLILFELVRAAGACALLPDLVLRAGAPGRRGPRAVRGGPVGRAVFLLTRSARTPAVEAVAAALRTAADAAAQ